MKPKTILILGASYYQIPAIIYAKKMGLYTIVCSNNVNDPGANIADCFYNVSTDNFIEILRISQQNRINGIMTIASDFAMPTVAFVSKQMRLPNYPFSSIEIISNKYKLKNFLETKDVPLPKFYKCMNINDAIKFFLISKCKMIIKPLEASGSKGVFFISTINDITKYFEISKSQSFHEKGVIIEEYIYGREIGVECFIQKGKIELICCTNKYKNQYYVPIGHSVPCKIDNKLLLKIKEIINNCTRNLNLDTGPINFDIIISNNQPIVIDIGARLGGNFLPLLVERKTGINTIEATIKTAIGEKLNLEKKPTNLCYGIKIIGTINSGILLNIKQKDKVMSKYPNILSINYDYQLGQYVEKFDQGKNRIGDIFIEGETIKEINSFFDEIDQYLEIIVS